MFKVLRNHEDFTDFKNMPNSQIQDLTPIFHIFKKRMRKIVLLIDKSIKLTLPKYFPVVERVNKLYYSNLNALHYLYFITQQAITDYIKLMLKPEDLIGIINFQNNAKVVVPLTHKDPSAQERILKLAIPTTFNNKTSNIWNGIYNALTRNCSHIHKYT